MKRLIILLTLFTSAIHLNSQNNDTFEFKNDTSISYKLPVLADDIKFLNLSRKIKSFTKNFNGNNFNISISSPDSTLIIISELSPILNGSFTYYSFDSLNNTDSGIVSFSKVNMVSDVFPGDVNSDSLCNHLDLIPIGILFNKYGNPRHDLDANTSFVPRKVGNWFFNAGNINGKHADINGDGQINNLDIDVIKNSFGLSRGSYKPTLSPSSTSNILSVDNNIPDTVQISKDSFIVKLPLKITNNNSINAYALGYTISVKSQNKQNGQDTFYTNYDFIQNPNVLSSTLENTITHKYIQNNNQKSNIILSRKDGLNSSLGGGSHELGVVEVVVDVILAGITSKDDIRMIKIELTDVVLADNNNVLIPISPVSKNIYLQKDFNASIKNETQNIISVYPNPIQSQLVIDKKSIKDDDISIYNTLGMKIYEVKLTNRQTMISNINWNSGIYYLKVESTGQIVKLIKQ